MKFEVQRLKTAPLEYDLDEKPKSLDLSLENVEFNENVRGRITLTLYGTNILIRGYVETGVALICARCLESFRHKLRCEVSLLYTDEAEAKEKDDELFDPEQEIVFEYSGDYVDPSKEIRDSILLEVPSYPICDEKCEGLCPVCGENKNKKKCKCSEGSLKEKTSKDPWKDTLKKLKDDSKK